jgi:hypothetical protein
MANVVEGALHSIHAELRIDQEWTAWWDGGFSWLGYRLRQDFEVGPAFIDAGTELHRVYSTVPILENVRPRGPGMVCIGSAEPLCRWRGSRLTIIAAMGFPRLNASRRRGRVLEPTQDDERRGEA